MVNEYSTYPTMMCVCVPTEVPRPPDLTTVLPTGAMGPHPMEAAPLVPQDLPPTGTTDQGRHNFLLFSVSHWIYVDVIWDSYTCGQRLLRLSIVCVYVVCAGRPGITPAAGLPALMSLNSAGTPSLLLLVIFLHTLRILCKYSDPVQKVI